MKTMCCLLPSKLDLCKGLRDVSVRETFHREIEVGRRPLGESQ